MDHLLLALNTSHVSSLTTAPRDSITMLPVILLVEGIHYLRSGLQIQYMKQVVDTLFAKIQVCFKNFSVILSSDTTNSKFVNRND